MLSSIERPPQLGCYVRTVSGLDMAHQCSVQVDVATVKIRRGGRRVEGPPHSGQHLVRQCLQCNAWQKAT